MSTSRFFIALGVVICLVLSPVIALVPADTTQAQPADSPWPMSGQNPQRTSHSPYGGPEVPELKWDFITYEPTGPPAIGADGTIYVGCADGTLHAIDPADGTEKWYFRTWSNIARSPAISTWGSIYFGSDNGFVYAVNPDGTEKWKFQTEGMVRSCPAIGTWDVIYIGSNDGNLYAIYSNSGLEKWRFHTGGEVTSSPAITADGSVIYVGSEDGNLYAVNRGDGSMKWCCTTSSPISAGPAIGADGTIYVGCLNGNIYAIRHTDGLKMWVFPVPTGGTINSGLAIKNDGTIYFGTNDGYLYAVEKTNGTFDWWSFTAGGPNFSPPTIGNDGTIYIKCTDYNLYAINRDGTEKWSLWTGNEFGSSVVIGADDTIYVGLLAGLWAIGRPYTLTVAPRPVTAPLKCPASGVTDPGYGTFYYAEGTVVNLVAEVEEGCCFVSWTGDVDTVANVNAASTTITMNGDYYITAGFQECPSPPQYPATGVCFIATAAYDTPLAKEIETLREFRDEYLLTNPVGQALVDVYYRASPPMAKFITEHPGLKPVVRAGLLPAVAMSSVAVNTSPAEKMAVVGFLVLVAVALAVWAARRRAGGPEYTSR